MLIQKIFYFAFRHLLFGLAISCNANSNRKNRMRLLFSLLFLLLLGKIQGGFLYGAPCSTANTAELTITKPVLPTRIDCVEVSGLAKNVSALKSIIFDRRNVTSLTGNYMDLTRKAMVFLLRSFPSLEVVDLSYSKIKLLPRRLDKYSPRLDKLLVPHNKIKMPKFRSLLVSDSLQTLMLSGNGIRTIRAKTFQDVPNLRVLYLDSNFLQVIEETSFFHLRKLKYLHLGNNLLSRLPPKNLLPDGLKALIFKGNKNISIADGE